MTWSARLLQFIVLVPTLWQLSGAAPFNEQEAISSRQAPTNDLNPYQGKPRITFARNGTFKLTVFSDLHFGENPWDAWGPEQDANSTRLMKRVLGDEKPDFVIINGDLITGENAFKENATSLIDEIVAPLNAAKIPFSSSYGNHDNQANITHLEEIQREQHIAPLSYTRTAPKGVGGEEGPGNYWVPVYKTAEGLVVVQFCDDYWLKLHAAAADKSPVLVLWFFDSRGGFSPGPNSVAVPDWVDSSVADWIKSETNSMEAAWGPGEGRSALAFVHIPPHTILPLQSGLNSTKNPGLNADELGDGSVQATTNPSSVDKDGPFWDSLNTNVKNLRAVISGHDHGNEWCVREPTKDVIFCFDKHSGYGGYGDASWGYGVRNILFSSSDPKDDVETWIRLEEGETRAMVTLNNAYGR